jgi:AraC family transcriptional regulator of adaptative response / DNA-3-methyladenine glycosylase II
MTMSENGQRRSPSLDLMTRVELDPAACYEALKTRDARFDGRFFTGVTSTGIYCRPICPARLPARKNVRFYAFAAAAEEAGFRACKRCRPDRSPDSPDWDWRGDLVGRALRLIGDGVSDVDGIPAIADRLGVSERHLRRLFLAELGAAPGSVARTRRVQLARRLIEESTMPLSDVAHAAGFSSIRRFNWSLKTAFGRTPTDLRRIAAPERNGAACRLTLAYRSPLAADHLFSYLARRATPGVEEVTGTTYRRTVRVGKAAGTIELKLDRDAIRLAADIDSVEALAAIVRRARHMLDLDADPEAISVHLGKDRALGPQLRRTPGMRVPGAFDGFELAVRAVLGQQVSVAAATTLAGRLATRFGEPVAEPTGSLTHHFPSPDELAGAALGAIGLPARRAATIRSLARAVAEGAIVLDGTADLKETEAALLAIPGFGPWTVSYIAMRALRDPDAFPATDLGIKHALERLQISTDEQRQERWSPWRAYATMYLWSSLATT